MRCDYIVLCSDMSDVDFGEHLKFVIPEARWCNSFFCCFFRDGATCNWLAMTDFKRNLFEKYI